MPAVDPARDAPTASAVAGRRWLMVSGLLLLEYGLLSYMYDALQVVYLAGGGLELLGRLGTIAPLAVVAATATLLLLGPENRALLLEVASHTAASDDAKRFVGLNLAVYGVFLWLTGRIFDGPLATSPQLAGWVVLWLALGAGVVGSLVPAIMPWSSWRMLIGRMLPALGSGFALGLVAWLAGLGSAQLWEWLSAGTLTTVAAVLRPFVNDMVYMPEDLIIGSERFFVIVAPECSGLEGLGLMSVFLTLYLISARKRLRFPRALWLLPVGLVAVWVGNALRIAALILVGIHVSPDVALGGFHSKAGWLFFSGVALLLVALSRRSRMFGADEEVLDPSADAGAAEYHNPTAAYLMPLLALLATALVTGLFAVSFDPLYGLRVLAVLAALFVYRHELPKPRWPPSWEAPLMGALVFAFWLPLVGTPAPGAGAALADGVAGLGEPLGSLWLALRVMGAVVTVPIAEELAFRGFLMRRLVDAEFTEVSLRRLSPLALGVSSLAFGVVHSSWLAGGLAGLCYALVAARRGLLADAVVAHAVTNALIAGSVLLHGHYWLW